MELMQYPVSESLAALWDVKVKVKSQGKISRLTSINHAVEFTMSPNE